VAKHLIVEEKKMNALEVIKDKVFDVIGVQDIVVAEMNEKALALKSSGIDDKEKNKDIHDLRMVFVRTRTAVTKKGEELRAEAVKYSKDVIAEQKRIIEMLAVGESHLIAEENAVKEKIEEIKREKERLLEEKTQGRIDRLCAMGATYNGKAYVAHGILIMPDTVRNSSDEDYEGLLQIVQGEIDKETARLAEEAEAKRIEQERLDKIAADQAAEKERLEDIERKQKEEANQLRAEQEKIELEKQRIKDEEAARVKKIEDDKAAAEAEKIRAFELEKAKKEAAEKAIKDAEEKARKEADAKAKKEAADKLAADRRAARQPDKVKLKLYVQALSEVPQPEMKTDDGKGVLGLLIDEIGVACSHANSRIEEM